MMLRAFTAIESLSLVIEKQDYKGQVRCDVIMFYLGSLLILLFSKSKERQIDSLPAIGDDDVSTVEAFRDLLRSSTTLRKLQLYPAGTH